MDPLPDNNILISKLPILCLDRSFSDYELDQDEETDSAATRKAEKLVCHVCCAIITSRAEQIAVQGSLVHSRINPAGFSYNFKCYSSAPGCLVTGVPSAEHCWFNGYLWQVASCNHCLEHLGWLFKGESRFYGLIQGRIVEESIN